jgi:hypothetical protein
MRRLKLSAVVALAAGVASSLFAPRPAKAIVLVDQWFRNKSAPSGTIAGSGWQYEGNWGTFVGTPIGRNYFITASHVGGGVGQSLVLNGVSYPTVAMYDDPSTDLRIWKTSKSFSSWAPIYTNGLEVGKTGVLFGRGTARGSDVNANGALKGWQWGATDNKLSWGQNKLKGVVNGGSGIGDVLSFSFDRSGHGDHVTNEGGPSAGDSSGAVFVNSYGAWKLAGVIYSAENPFKTSSGGSTFNANIFDKGGLYYNNSFVSDTSTDNPQQWYATRISSRGSWINSVLNGSASPSAAAVPGGSVVPEPTSAGILLGATGLVALRRRRRRA